MNDTVYKLYSPKIKLEDQLDNIHLLREPEVLAAINKADENYLHWEALKHKSWIPKKFFSNNEEAFWSLLSMKRFVEGTQTPIKDTQGTYFKINTQNYTEFLHVLDKETAGNFMGISHFSETNKKQFITRNIIEEAIASSQIEGANTSRAVAKKMLLEGRQPQNHSERMIVNNHKTMLRIEQELYKENLSLPLLFELHSMITDQTLPTNEQGKLRNTLNEKGERLKVVSMPGTIGYITPDKEFVEAELPRLIDFANDKSLGMEKFTHPLVKAIMLHFWIGLLHPFEDGNGRLARILFYWYMLKHDYWAFKYLSLSEKIKKSPKQYAMAYIYSEQDNCDLTYFLHYNIEKLKLAQNEFKEYINKKINENHTILNSKQEKYKFNARQIRLLHYFNQEMESRTNLTAYQQLYSVKKGSAVADLNELTEKGFLVKKKLARNTFYYPTKKVDKFFDLK